MSEPTPTNSAATSPLYACSCCGAFGAPRYVSPTGFANGSGQLALVTPDTPLPVMLIDGGSRAPSVPFPENATPLAGKTANSAVVGPFVTGADLPIHLQLAGVWKGKVTFERSTDGGATRQGVTIGGRPWGSFTTNVNEPIWQETDPAASFWLNIVLESGEVSYRLS